MPSTNASGQNTPLASLELQLLSIRDYKIYTFVLNNLLKAIMGLYEYNLLSATEQMNILEKKGIFLMNRSEGKFFISLYSVYSFYVEIWMDTTFNKLRTFRSTTQLEPYLEILDINSFDKL